MLKSMQSHSLQAPAVEKCNASAFSEAAWYTLMFLLMRRQIWWLRLCLLFKVIKETTLLSSLSPTFSLQHFPSMDAMDGIRHVNGRKWCLSALMKWLDCTYSRCFLNVLLSCYYFIAVKLLISAPLLGTPEERHFKSSLYPQCPVHARKNNTK